MAHSWNYIDRGVPNENLPQCHFVQKVLRITFRHKREEVTLGSRVMYNEELNDLYSFQQWLF
jgi:hypothetical protein